MVATRCYKPTVNESETIKAAQGTSAADLKSLHCKLRTRPRDFKSSGTSFMNLLVPMAFRSSQKIGAATGCELRKVSASTVRGGGGGNSLGLVPIERS